MKKIIYLLIMPLTLNTACYAQTQEFSNEQIQAFNEYQKYSFEEDKADATILMVKLDGNIECYSSFNKIKGYQSMKSNNFDYTNSTMLKRSVLCFNDKIALMSSSDSVYVKLSNNTFVSYINNAQTISETIETIQLDYQNKKFKYTKNILIDKNSKYTNIQGVSSFIGDLIKLTK